MAPAESTLRQPNHTLDTHAQLLTSQVIRGQLNRETQASAVRTSPVMCVMSPSTLPQSASSPLASNGLPTPARGRKRKIPSGTNPTCMRMAHWSHVLDPACNTGSGLHTTSGCQQTNSQLLTNTSLVRNDIPSKAHMTYDHIEQDNSQLPSSHHPTNVAYRHVPSGPYPRAQGLAKPLNPTIHSLQRSPGTGDQQHFHPTETMIRTSFSVAHTSDYIFYPGVRSTVDPQATCYAAGPNSNLLLTNAPVITHAEVPMVNPCSDSQFANPQSRTVLAHPRNALARPSTNALQNSNSGAYSALSLERSIIGSAPRAASSSQPLHYGFQPLGTSDRSVLCIDSSNSQQNITTQIAGAGVGSNFASLLGTASPTNRVQARMADVNSADAHASTVKTPRTTKGRPPKRYRPRKKTPAAKPSELNSDKTIECAPVSRGVFSETAPQMQIHKETCLQRGDGDNPRRKGIQSENCGGAPTEYQPNISRPAASSVQSIPPSFSTRMDLPPKPRKSNEELEQASSRPSSTAVQTGDRYAVSKNSEVERRPSHSERNHRVHRLPLHLRVKASASVFSPASDDTQTPLTPHSTGDQSSPDAVSLGGTNAEEDKKRTTEPRRSTLAVSGLDEKQSREKKQSSKPVTHAQDHGATKNQRSVLLKLRLRKSKTKFSRRVAISKRKSLFKRASSSKLGPVPSPRPQRQSRARFHTPNGAAELTRPKISVDECLEVKKPLRPHLKSKTQCGKQAMPKKARVSDTEVTTKKPSSTQKAGRSDEQLVENFARKGRPSELSLFTPVPIQEPRANLRLMTNDFDAELVNLQREGHIKTPLPLSQTRAGKSGALGGRELRCLLCTESVSRSQAFIHPRFPAKNFFLCGKCHHHVDSRIKRESAMVCVPISDSPNDVLRRISFFVMVVESIILGFPPSERETREIAKVHACVLSRKPSELRKRAEFINLPFETTALLRVVLRKLGVTIQRNRLRWRLQPIRLPSCPDLIEIISQAIPPSLEDMIRGSTPGKDAWNTVFPKIKLDANTSSFLIISNLMALIGVRLRHLCSHNTGCFADQGECLVQFDLLSVCSAMHRARVMVSGTVVESLFRVWDPDAAARYLELTDARLANGTSTGRLSNICSVCTQRQDQRNYPFRFFSCLSCSHEFCSVCVSNVLSPSEYALANAGAYKCLLCRVDATVHTKLLRSGGLYDVIPKTKMANGAAAQNASKSRPQLPMLLVSRDLRKQVIRDGAGDGRTRIVGFAKLCEGANSHTCGIGPSSSEAHAPSAAYPTKAAANGGNGFDEWCFSCKLPVDNQVSNKEQCRHVLQDDQPSILRCVNENCGVVMHRECSPPDHSRRRRAGRPKWSCPRHKCHVCASRDDSRLFKCRTCALALCKDHMFKPSEVYLYSEKLFACKECMKNLRAPRPSLMDRLPKRKSEFIQALNVPQAKRRRLAEKGMSDGLPPSYPGCIE